MERVKVWSQRVIIPTYEVGEADKNPMFLEKRVYQGSSGKVYPIPIIDKISDEKIDKEYEMIFLENEYLRIEILPELGGRIQRALDKTNNYDFVYYNHVIKPALVGLAGPWISGGIEFNWPQHHRPSTFAPVEYEIEKNEDGSKTVWVSEIDKMYGTKGMAGFTLYPGKAYLEIKGQIYNGTQIPQTFLWWANPAVAVNDYTKSIFPPDVNAVFDHGKRAVSRFPIATGEYYKVDYSAGVDIGRYKNIPVPTSYMAYHSDFNFVGGYDFNVNAGILHVTDHHISPGKKQWTWGSGDFGKAWDRNLTDNDGPYIELMTGVYTDNQPDFTWLQPYETKTFRQYFMPYKNVGEVKNASIEAAINLEIKSNEAEIIVYTTSYRQGIIVILKDIEGKVYSRDVIDISPTSVYSKVINLNSNKKEYEYILQVLDSSGVEIISYTPKKEEILEIPKPAKPALMPEEINDLEELYLTSMHLEQYRHATYDPELYYLEGLKRSPKDIRINNAYGALLFRRGLFNESEKYFNKAIERLTEKNPNPYDGEPYYNLGLALKMQGKLDKAFDAFYKATWNGAWQDSGFYSLAQIASIKKEYNHAEELINKSIYKNYVNLRARLLKSIILRRLEKYNKAESLNKETLTFDILDFGAKFELYKIYNQINKVNDADEILVELMRVLRNDPHNYLELAISYGEAGAYEEAIEILNMYKSDNPEILYYIGYFYKLLNKNVESLKFYKLAEKATMDYCFPNKLHSIAVLEDAINQLSISPKAKYYLGCLFYDKKQHMKAIELWENSLRENDEIATVHRNLALAYFNKKGDRKRSREELEKAFFLNRNDARILFELDQLYKKLLVSFKERLNLLEENIELVKSRDDLYIEYVTLYNNLGRYEEALNLIMSRKFHPWEGGEGKVPAQYVISHSEIAKKLLESNKIEESISHLKMCKVYPNNLGEGKLYGVKENKIDYLLGLAYEKSNENEVAKKYFEKASRGLEEPTDVMYYNDQPADTIFYQGLALRKLGKELEARGRFNKLYDYGESHIFDERKIDYFAVSLPDFLVFEDNLNIRNKVHCNYLMALGCLGLGKDNKAKELFEKALKLDSNHQGLIIHNEMI